MREKILHSLIYLYSEKNKTDRNSHVSIPQNFTFLKVLLFKFNGLKLKIEFLNNDLLRESSTSPHFSNVQTYLRPPLHTSDKKQYNYNENIDSKFFTLSKEQFFTFLTSYGFGSRNYLYWRMQLTVNTRRNNKQMLIYTQHKPSNSHSEYSLTNNNLPPVCVTQMITMDEILSISFSAVLSVSISISHYRKFLI